VTVIIGLKTKHGICLASDSQTTYGSAKRTDARKISAITFSNNATGLVAQAGSAVTGGRAVEILTDLAAKTSLDHPRVFADLGAIAMRKLKDELRAQQGDCSMAELREYVFRGQLDCELMLANYFNGKPCVYMISLDIGIATLEQSDYAVCGCGGNLATFLLRDRPEIAELEPTAAIALSVHVIEQVKEADAFCGGPTKIGYLHNNGKVSVPSHLHIEKLVTALKSCDQDLAKQRRESINAVLWKAVELWDEMDNAQFSK